MAKTPKDSIEYSHEHVTKRLAERYGFVYFPLKDYEVLNKRIRDGEGKLVSVEVSTENPQKVYEIVYANTTLLVVWNEKRNRITTVLPR